VPIKTFLIPHLFFLLTLLDPLDRMQFLFVHHVAHTDDHLGCPASHPFLCHRPACARYTQLRKDVMRTSKLQYRNNLLNLVLFQPTVAMNVLRNDLRYVLLQSHTAPRFYEQCVKEVAVLFTVTGALLYLSPWKFFILFYLPHFVAQYG